MKKISLSLFLMLSVSLLFQQYTPDFNPPSQEGKVVYEQSCLSCHQENGKGVPGMNPPLSRTEWVLGNKSRLIKIVLNGLKTPIEINGESYHNPMPSQAHLTDKQIADVLTYVRSNFGNKASAVTVDEVKKVRSGK